MFLGRPHAWPRSTPSGGASNKHSSRLVSLLAHWVLVVRLLTRAGSGARDAATLRVLAMSCQKSAISSLPITVFAVVMAFYFPPLASSAYFRKISQVPSKRYPNGTHMRSCSSGGHCWYLWEDSARPVASLESSAR